MNIALLHGRLGADPELRTTKGGTSVTDLRIATPDREKQGDEWVDAPNWHTVTVWGRDAENCAKYLRKGDGVIVKGRIKYEKWTDKEGNEKWSTKIVAEMGGIDFGAKAGNGSSSGNSGGSDKYSGPDPDAPFN